jgi:hypothetical protein
MTTLDLGMIRTLAESGHRACGDSPVGRACIAAVSTAMQSVEHAHEV